VHGFIILILPPPPTCVAYTIAILMHDYCAVYDPLGLTGRPRRAVVRNPFTSYLYTLVWSFNLGLPWVDKGYLTTISV